MPHIEDGTITLLGATTENPSFQLNSALLSRCRVIVLEKLKSPEIENLLRRALSKVGAVEKIAAYEHSSRFASNFNHSVLHLCCFTNIEQ